MSRKNYSCKRAFNSVVLLISVRLSKYKFFYFSAVSNITAVALNSSSIFLQWDPAKGSLYTGYNVTYAAVSGGPTWHVVLQRDASWVDLVNLRGMTAYSIKVGLLVANSETFWSEEVLCSTLPGGEIITVSFVPSP